MTKPDARRCRMIPVLLALAATALRPAVPSGAERFPNVRQVGATVMLYEDDVVRVIVGHKYASLHPEARFLPLDLAVTAMKKEVRVHRELITLRLPSGATLPMTTQQRIGERWAEIGPMFQAAGVADDPLSRYMKSRFERVSIGFILPRPGSGIVRDRFAVNTRVFAEGPILFESPDGRWRPGIYLLRLVLETVTVDIPFEIPPPARAGSAKGLDSPPADP